MFKKFLVRFNIGSAKVDTMLDKSEFMQGETVEGMVRLYGGNVDQEIEEITLQLVCLPKIGDSIIYQENDIWQEVKIQRLGVLKPGEVRDIYFELKIPDNMPVLWKNKMFHSYIKTGVDIKQVIDPKDQDEVKILPDRYARLLLDTLKELNIRPKDIGQTYNDDGNFPPYYQFLYFETEHPTKRLKDTFKITYLGKGEFLWRGFKFQVTDEDLADGGQRLKKFILDELAYKDTDLLVQTLEKLNIFPKTLVKDNEELMFLVAEEYQPRLSEVYLSYLGERKFQLVLSSQGVQEVISEILDINHKVTIEVKPSDHEDQGQRLEALLRDILVQYLAEDPKNLSEGSELA